MPSKTILNFGATRDICNLPTPLSSGQPRVSVNLCSSSPRASPLTRSPENFIQATKEFGIPVNDQATGNAFGGYFCTHNMDPVNYTRSSAREAYYASAAGRPNFHILTGNQVTRILTSSSNGVVKVTGVEFATSREAVRQTVKINGEVILAAGSLHTPQLLQVSGIGDSKHLASINVTTVVDLPAVGHNLHDHLNAVVVNARKSPELPCRSRIHLKARTRSEHNRLDQYTLFQPHLCS